MKNVTNLDKLSFCEHNIDIPVITASIADITGSIIGEAIEFKIDFEISSYQRVRAVFITLETL
ncbi:MULTISPECIES: hypothetical protein [unclassified Dehalobacter]|uniref:hypothetical protein n=1 Tax=unclassified Dehalobacter TaxID=2635733 RepID=UPI000E6B8A07|nr:MULTISPECIES: hypothetical protein [unclassified Dehalobacter]RJE47144.1 hypothetical protein A7K50_03990 [Dehalobacter sp. MCB1]TCX53695.1 hypothetical protein C1I36_02850 [Dehalobacter sp. 14DCB1]TCX54998.1 hypothetical protein C1I38_04815 [Dehalobacter sp. 12DCB1]